MIQGLNSRIDTPSGSYEIETATIPSLFKVVCKVFKRGKIVDFSETPYDEELPPKSLLELIHLIHEKKLEELSTLSHITQELVKENKASFYNQLGEIFLRRGFLEEAELYLHKALELKKNFPEVYLNMGRVYQYRNDFGGALTYLDMGLLFSSSPELLYQKALCYRGLKREKEAMEELKKAIDKNPNFAKAHFLLGLLFIKESQEKAVEYIEKAQNLSSLYRNHLIEDGLNLLKQRKEEEAIQLFNDFETIIMEKDSLPFISKEFDLFLRYTNHSKRAIVIDDYIEKLRERLKEHPDFADLHNELGKIYLLAIKHYWNRAVSEFKKATMLDPNYEDAKRNLEITEYELRGFLLFLRGLHK